MTSYTLFETAIGWAGLAWGDRGLVGVHLPEPTPDSTRRSFLLRYPEAAEATPPPEIEAAIGGIRGLLTGEPNALLDVPIDIARVPEFNARVYEIARAIPPGETLTYGEIAVKLGDKLLWPIVVPCHRVTAAGGKLGGFSARGGVNTKLKLLAIEGAEAARQPARKPPAASPAPAQPSLFE